MLNESFHYRDGELWCDAVTLGAIAGAVGTPAYVYSAGRVRTNVRRLQAVFAPLNASIHYSIKANGNRTLLRLLNAEGLGMDAVSAGEIFRAREAGIDPGQIVFAGVGKTQAELAYALDVAVGWINVESAAELSLLDSLASRLSHPATVALRVNPGIEASTHRHIATGHFGAKFGMLPDVISELLARQADYPHVQIRGLHVHIGSQLSSVDETVEAVRIVQALAEPYPAVRALNIGGGFPVSYGGTDTYPSLAAFADALAPLVTGWHLLIEPGRSIMADAGLLLVSVLYVKEQGGQRFVITDGSMTDLLRPALYEAVHPVLPCRQGGAVHPAVVAGPVCESADVLSRSALLPELTAGDRLAVMVAGAYGLVMASNYNMRTRPPEVLVEADRWRVIRRRETWDDMLRLEREE